MNRTLARTADRLRTLLRPATGRAPQPRRRAASALALCLALAAIAAPAAAEAQTDPLRLRSSSVGVADGQYARLNAHFVKSANSRGELPPGPCRVTLRFVDQGGAAVAESVVVLGPGRATLLDYAPRGLRSGERVMVRADLIAEADERGLVPAVLPTLEIVDTASGRTAVADPGAIRGFNPQPEPPGDSGLFGLASQQVARLSASYVGRPSDSGLPPGPCNVTLTLVSGDGNPLVSRELTVAPGQTVSLDFAAGAMPPGIRRRMSARVTTDGRAQGFVSPSVEVIDAPTGKAAVLLPSSFVLSWGWE